MNYKEVQQLQDKELEDKLKTLQSDYAQMQLKHTVDPLEKPHTLKEIRRDIARLLTEKNHRDSQVTVADKSSDQ